MLRLEELKPYENNPRDNDEAVDYVANSIREFGFNVPIIIDKDRVIIAGHTRLKAAQKLGIGEVPCIMADDLTQGRSRRFAWWITRWRSFPLGTIIYWTRRQPYCSRTVSTWSNSVSECLAK